MSDINRLKKIYPGLRRGTDGTLLRKTYTFFRQHSIPASAGVQAIDTETAVDILTESGDTLTTET